MYGEDMPPTKAKNEVADHFDYILTLADHSLIPTLLPNDPGYQDYVQPLVGIYGADSL